MTGKTPRPHAEIHSEFEEIATRLAKGDTLRIVATVKNHAEYNGIKQTLIQRPKIAA